MKASWVLSKPFQHLLRWSCEFDLNSFIWFVMFLCIYVEPPCIYRIKPIWSRWIIFFALCQYWGYCSNVVLKNENADFLLDLVDQEQVQIWILQSSPHVICLCALWVTDLPVVFLFCVSDLSVPGSVQCSELCICISVGCSLYLPVFESASLPVCLWVCAYP